MSRGERAEIKKEGLFLGGKPFYLASGDMHYFRSFKGSWERRLRLMKDFGLTAVQTYIPWNLHEPQEGVFDFEGNLNIAEFFELCGNVGLKVMLRPSPYICSEWDWGGLPSWLMNKKDMFVRTNSPAFNDCLRKYYTRLAKEFVPYLSTNGGPIIAVAVENEYGSFGDDRSYIKATGDLLKELGTDVPLYTANGWEPFKLLPCLCREYWNMLDLHELDGPPEKAIRSCQPDKPVAVAEFWCGRTQQWGGYFLRQTAEEVAQKYRSMLEKNAYVNFYMFCGGTNFGFYNGATVGKLGADRPDAPNRYIPFTTSYDGDALVDESGTPTEKYFACKKVLRDYLNKENIPYSGSDDYERPKRCSQSIGRFRLEGSADLLRNVKNIAADIKETAMPITMEKMNQDYGFILYSSDIIYTDNKKRLLKITGLHDRALVYGNGSYLGCEMRDRANEPIVFSVPETGMHLDILVENMGRVNYGNAMPDEQKGICGFVKTEILEDDGTIYPFNYTFKMNWKNYSLPLKDLSKLDFTKKAQKDRPAFYRGIFEAKPGIDTYLNLSGWEKGIVMINGFDLGRYWDIGPQGTLYVPGELLQETNTICVFELRGYKGNGNASVQFDSEPSLDLIAAPECELKVTVMG